MAATAHARLTDAAPVPAPHRGRRIRRERVRAPWPGDLTPHALHATDVADVPAWIEQRAQRPIKQLWFSIGAIGVLDVSFVLLRLSLG